MMACGDEKMLIKTPLGTLVAYPSDTDESRPGIFVDLRRPGFGVDAPLVFIECDPTGDEPKLVSRVWGDVNYDDATDCITHERIRKFFSCFGPGGAPCEYPADGE